MESSSTRRNGTRTRPDFLLNGAIGYRLPKNRGLLSLEVDNLLDSSLSLQNSLVNSARPSTRPLAEELSVVARMTLSF